MYSEKEESGPRTEFWEMRRNQQRKLEAAVSGEEVC